MEPQSALVGTDSTIELHSIADVHLHLALIVGPGHAELDDTLRLHKALYNLSLLKFGMLIVDIGYRQQHFPHSLQILRFTGVLSL